MCVCLCALVPVCFARAALSGTQRPRRGRTGSRSAARRGRGARFEAASCGRTLRQSRRPGRGRRSGRGCERSDEADAGARIFARLRLPLYFASAGCPAFDGRNDSHHDIEDGAQLRANACPPNQLNTGNLRENVGAPEETSTNLPRAQPCTRGQTSHQQRHRHRQTVSIEGQTRRQHRKLLHQVQMHHLSLVRIQIPECSLLLTRMLGLLDRIG